MFHSTRRFLNAALAVLVVFTLLLGFVKPAFAEGEVPEDTPPAAAPAPEGEESPETLEQALSDGSAAVADAGVLVPLASQSELDESCLPDPWFYGTGCVGGSCRGLLPGEDGFVTIQEALDAWKDNNGVGYIYLEGDYDQDETLYITDITKFSTLKGIVWDDQSSGTPQLTGSLTVENLLAGFLLQGFAIDGEVTFSNNKGLIKLEKMTINQGSHDGYGLMIDNHTGPVTLNQVRVENALNTGVSINNVSLTGAATGAVTVSNLTILNTSGDSGISSPWYGGLLIRSNSPISINGLFILETAGGGALILPGPGAVTIKNGYIGFSRDFAATTTYQGFGLKIAGGDDPAGTITLDNLRLYDNQSDGILIENAGVVKLNNVYSSGNYEGYGLHLGDTDNPDTAKSLTITNSEFKWNGTGGALVVMRGPVSITNTTFSDNRGDGATGLSLDNRALAGAPVVLNGVSANDNNLSGMLIFTRGSATLTGIEAFNNKGTVDKEGFGANIDASAGLGNVTLTNAIFNDNGYGLYIKAQKNITLKLVEASNNIIYGAKLDNDSGTGNVTLLGLGTSGNHFHWNGESGLAITSSGTVTITNIYTDRNGNHGVYIDNSSGLGRVSILAASPYWMNTFTWNQGEAGLKIISKGNIKLVNVSAWDNNENGVYLNNCSDNGGCTGTGSVTISSLGTGMVNGFSNNGYTGLFVNSFGSISLTNVEASRNGFTGVWLMNERDNSLGTESTGNITLTNLTGRDFSDNGVAGISAISYGNITIKGVNANNNFSRGGQFGNWGAGSSARTVTISNSTFNGSQNDMGLIIVHNGKVILSSVSANWNDMVEGSIGLGESVRERINWNRQGQPDSWTYTGIAETTEIAGLLSSYDFTTVLTVLDYGTEAEPVDPPSVVAPNWAGEYFWFDTEVDHKYEFVIAGDTADYSGRYIFELYGYEDSGDGTPVDLGKTHIYDGLGGIGIYVNNSYGTGAVTITNPVTSRAEVSGNSGDGLWIRSNGAVTVNNLVANDNGNMGVNITTNYDNSIIPATVNLSGLETNWNGWNGVSARTLGSIVYSSSAARGNSMYGARFDNCQGDDFGGCEATVMKSVTLSKLILEGNGWNGAVVYSFGSITAGGITSRSNNGFGLLLDNRYTGSTGTVTLLGTLGQNVFEYNNLAGMRTYSYGNVTLSNFLVKANGGADFQSEERNSGMYISAGGKVLLSSGTVEENPYNGILIDSYGSVTMSKMLVMINGWNWLGNNDRNGIEIYAHDNTVTLTTSLVFGNDKHGLAIVEGVGDPTLTGTIFFGNDLDGSGDADVEY